MKKQIEGPALKLDYNYERLILSDDNQSEQLPKLQKGVIVVAGRNFGTVGELSETFNSAGVACVIAASFSRIFYRSCINSGLPLIENREAFDKIVSGESLSIDFDKGQITGKKGILSFSPYPEIISKILLAGGLIPHTKKTLGK
jgi:3-isopropylmalate/(R)-2-methylmalate dehydratase small subunit